MNDITDNIEASSVTQAKIPEIIQTGSGTPPPIIIAYVAFAKAYGTPPTVVHSFFSNYAGASGTLVRPFLRILRVRPGSFSWQGSPSGRVTWIAVGIGTTAPR